MNWLKRYCKGMITIATIAMIWGKAWPVLVAILYFGFLILSHELGHFSIAKAFKVKVLEFSMGMGPRLFKRRKGETLYSLKAFPFGGSCLMEGEDDESADPRAFGRQKPWKRFCILFAGAFVNLLCGVVIMAIVVGANPRLITTTVRGFPEGAKSGQTGLQSGDVILKINGKRVCSYMDIDFLLSRDKDGKVDLMVRRADKKVTLPAVQFPMESYEEGGSPIAYADFAPVFFSRLQEDTARAGTPKAGVIARDTLGKSISVGRMVWLSLLDMVTGKFKLQDISGPIGVVSILSDGAQQVQSEASGGDRVRTLESLLWLLTLFSMISINIGFMNLLPLPALDGGRLFFCLVEMIFRKPIPKRFEAWVHGVGIVLLMLFMAVISFSDIWALATGKR